MIQKNLAVAKIVVTDFFLALVIYYLVLVHLNVCVYFGVCVCFGAKMP